jgi:hypothetical protein
MIKNFQFQVILMNVVGDINRFWWPLDSEFIINLPQY